MTTCPSGHESASDDFCDECGIRIGTPALSSPGRTREPGQSCPRCGVPRDGQFCEACGWNFASAESQLAAALGPAPGAPATPATPAAPVSPASAPGDTRCDLPRAAWSATVTADRAYFDAVQAASGPEATGIDFPAYCPERRFRLSGSEVRIGRRSVSRGIEPEIDLTGPPADPGVSRLHAVLIAAEDGTWSVLDPGSANGTLVNGNELQPNEPVKLSVGDRVNLGAWTVLIVSRDN